jgi:SAM-dependent methyltransferase
MSREEKLAEFVGWAQHHITGDEKGQAQIFLDRLFQAFGHPGVLDVGGQTEFRIRQAAEDGGGTAFADLVWKPVVLFEMKKRGVDLQRHYRQAFDYWTRLVPNRPRYVVLCNFDQFRVYDFETQMDAPVDTLPLAELPARWGPLAFLFPGDHKPTFNNDRVAVTREAADALANCFKRLVRPDRSPPVPRPMAQRFTLQMLVALFAEDIGLLEKYFVTNLLNECHSPTDSYDLIGGLFAAMNSREAAHGGRFKDIPYFNGGLFADPARLELHDQELVLLRKAADFNWTKVQPEIFGTLFQHSMGDEERHAFGAHFTHPADIMKIVGPTIVQPWREQIDAAKTLKRLIELRDRLHNFRVLDPACGSGNFLYIAYRELKRLEAHLLERMQEFPSRAEPGQRMLSFLSAQNFYGLDIQPFAVEIAKVTMMIARKLAIDELHITEPALPFNNLDQNFIAADALITPDGQPAQWPKADVIIGNPPFVDARKLTMTHGREYVGKLEQGYPQVPRRADFCTYWFRKAHDHLPPCTAADPVAGRAGLVGTQNVRNNESREGGLDHIVKTGTILEAVENQPWSGEANVSVSIANWVKTRDAALLPEACRLWFKVDTTGTAKKLRKRGTGPASKEYELDFRECALINSALSSQTDVVSAKALECNRRPKRCFEGQQPGHDGFRLTASERAKLLKEEDAADVLFAYVNGTALLTDGITCNPTFIIDFGNRNMLEASAFPKTLEIVRQRVLADWQKDAAAEQRETGRTRGEHQGRVQRWWTLKRRRQELLDSVSKIGRYIVCSRVTKRPIFSFLSSEVHPDSSLTCFAFEDDYSFGILQSYVHWLWFTTKCSKLTERFRYTPDTVFDTFPWPQPPTPKQIEAVAQAGREIRRVRAEALGKIKGGLRALYRTLELPGANPLKDAHAALDAAVLAAYGFSAKRDLLAQLLALNLEVAHRIEKGEPVTAPGVPKDYPDAEELVTEDCIEPVSGQAPS